MVVALLLAVGLPVYATPSAVTAEAAGPEAMIALADSDPHRSHKGLFRIVIRAAAKPGRITFLNSDADYRAPRNVSFSLAPSVSAKLARQLGNSPEAVLIGKSITVEGVLVRVPVANTVNQRAHDFNRWAYQVRVEQFAQIKAIEG